ncbi:hypothetical protein Tco_0615504, partial [Tanacetum coccineum]
MSDPYNQSSIIEPLSFSLFAFGLGNGISVEVELRKLVEFLLPSRKEG